jgi:hypothetical protein
MESISSLNINLLFSINTNEAKSDYSAANKNTEDYDAKYCRSE